MFESYLRRRKYWTADLVKSSIISLLWIAIVKNKRQILIILPELYFYKFLGKFRKVSNFVRELRSLLDIQSWPYLSSNLKNYLHINPGKGAWMNRVIITLNGKN